MKILVADDDPGCLWALDRILRGEHEVVTARNGAEAWEALKGPDAPPLALLDWVMPEMSGEEVCRRIRNEPAGAYRYILLVTGRADPAHVARGLEAGADDVMVKPWSVEEVLARVATAERILGKTRASARVFQAALDEAVRSAGGEVVARSGSAVGRVFVQGGRIGWVTLSTMPESFHAEFGDRIGIGINDWADLVRWCREDGSNVFQALVAGNLCSEETVTLCVRSYLAKRISAIARLPELSALFLPDVRRSPEGLLFDPEELRTDPSKPPPAVPLAQRPGRIVASLPPAGSRARAVPPEALSWLMPLMELRGALAAALIDLESGEAVWTNPDNGPYDMVLRAQCRTLRVVGAADPSSEMMTAANGAWHILVRLPERSTLCLYLVLREKATPPAMARIRLQQLAAAVTVAAA